MNDKVVVRVAVQNAVAELVPAVGVHVTAVERTVAPFLNCTVPVGPAPWLVVDTVALSTTLPPEVMLDGDAVTVVVVACPTIVNIIADELLALKLGSPL